MQTSKHPAVPLAMTAVMAAVMAVVAPFSISIGPIPLSLCTLVIYMNAYILGWKRGTVATLVYILLGAVGMPVFNSFSGGRRRPHDPHRPGEGRAVSPGLSIPQTFLTR